METHIEAERLLLSAMFLDVEAVWDANEILTPSDFGDLKHEVIFEAMLGLASAGNPVDAITVSDQIQSVSGFTDSFTSVYVFELMGLATSAHTAKHYAGIVREASQRRRLLNMAHSVVDGAETGENVHSLLDTARTVIEGTDPDSAPIRPVSESVEDLFADLEAGEEPFTPTPWKDMNRYINGFKPGGLYIIAARPGGGKSIQGLMSAAHLSKHGAVSFSSLEMDEKDLLRRLLASTADVELGSLVRNKLSREEMLRVRAAQNELAEMELYIDDRAGVQLAQIEARARKIARRGKLAGVVVDYLQLIESPDKRVPRWEHVGAVSRGLKVMAKDLQVPVIALSQINRESEKSGRLPGLADLRESGSIEQDADVVLMLQRRVDDQDEFTDEVDVVVAKNRQGAQGHFTLLWEGGYGRMVTLPWSNLTDN